MLSYVSLYWIILVKFTCCFGKIGGELNKGYMYREEERERERERESEGGREGGRVRETHRKRRREHAGLVIGS